jgi:hypothetical protein
MNTPHRRTLTLLAVQAALCVPAAALLAAEPAPNGITLPEGYKDWQVIASSHRSDNNTLRVILGNAIAVRAARAGQTRPWPQGAVLAKLVWKDQAHAAWPAAQVPGSFVHAEFMTKDEARFSATGGWGYARWVGMDQLPYGKDAGFAAECFACHTPVKDNDWVFTHPAVLP